MLSQSRSHDSPLPPRAPRCAQSGLDQHARGCPLACGDRTGLDALRQTPLGAMRFAGRMKHLHHGQQVQASRIHPRHHQPAFNELVPARGLECGAGVGLVRLGGEQPEDPLRLPRLRPAIAFWILDGCFLWRERLFRKLYDHVRALNDEEVDFSMSTSRFLAETASWWSGCLSKTLLVFHGTVLAAIIIVMVCAPAPTE